MSTLLVQRTSKHGFLMQGSTFDHVIVDDDFIPGEELIEYTVRVFRCGTDCFPVNTVVKLYLDTFGKSVKIADRKITVPLVGKIFPLLFQFAGGGVGTTVTPLPGQPPIPPVVIPGGYMPMPCEVYDFFPTHAAKIINLTEGFKAIEVVGNRDEIFFSFTTPVFGESSFEETYYYPDRFTPMGIFLAPGVWGFFYKMNSTTPGNLIFSQINPPDLG